MAREVLSLTISNNETSDMVLSKATKAIEHYEAAIKLLDMMSRVQTWRKSL